MFNRRLAGMCLIISAILLASCTMGQTPVPTADVSMISTQAMALVATQFSLQQTQTAMAIPPTPLPSPTISVPPTPFGGGVPSTPIGGSSPTVGAPLATPITGFGSATPGSGFLPLPSPTLFALASPTQACSNAMFTGQEYPLDAPDPTGIFKPGAEFDKQWTIMNTGTCNWDQGYKLVYLGGSLDGYTIKFDDRANVIKPGDSVAVTVHLTASLVPNTYQECWRMMDDHGYYFGPAPLVCVKIEVKK